MPGAAPCQWCDEPRARAAPRPRRGARSERRDQLFAALDALAPRQRAPLVLRYFAELRYDEIAALLGVSTRDVGVLLFRAKLRLREVLRGGGFA